MESEEMVKFVTERDNFLKEKNQILRKQQENIIMYMRNLKVQLTSPYEVIFQILKDFSVQIPFITGESLIHIHTYL